VIVNVVVGGEPVADGIADRDELLVLLSEAARKGRVGAMKILLIELRREPDTKPQQPASLTILEELRRERDAKA
jgi:hypothetical protein